MRDSKRSELRAAVAPFEAPSLQLAFYQIATSIGLYVGIVALMYWSLSISYVLTLALAFPASALLVRVFIIQHDCGHGSFFASKRGNNILGAVCGVLTLAPYTHWRRQHDAHHSNWNNLDRRESGADIYSTCLTVKEYRALTPWQRFFHRLSRHPLIIYGVIPPLVFLVLYRTPFDTPKSSTQERRSVWLTNFALLAVFIGLCLAFGFKNVVMVHLPIVFITTVVGVWLFSVQHRFETARWMRRGEWNFADAALEGSSYLKLPRILHWLTGNIGYHHIHHLSPRVPNYRLAACHQSNAVLRPDMPLTLDRAFGAASLTLWDEAQKKLVRFRDAAPSPAG
jgi:acyl-lipid omega-6 desaturase (Delta-12 desaturase)